MKWLVTYGFLDVYKKVGQELSFDYEINYWDLATNHAVGEWFLLEHKMLQGGDVRWRRRGFVRWYPFSRRSSTFYNPAKSTVNREDYLAVIPYLPWKFFSWFLAYFCALFLKKDTAEVGLDALMDFLEDQKQRRIRHGMEPRSLWRRKSRFWKKENFILIQRY